MVIDSINLLYKATLVYLEDPTNEMNLSIFNDEYRISKTSLGSELADYTVLRACRANDEL